MPTVSSSWARRLLMAEPTMLAFSPARAMLPVSQTLTKRRRVVRSRSRKRLPDGPKAGDTVKTTLFPITLGGHRLGVRLDPPRLGEHSRELLDGAGFSARDIDELLAQAVVA